MHIVPGIADIHLDKSGLGAGVRLPACQQPRWPSFEVHKQAISKTPNWVHILFVLLILGPTNVFVRQSGMHPKKC